MAEENVAATAAAATSARTPATSAPAERVTTQDYLEALVTSGKRAGLLVVKAKPGYTVTPTDLALPLVDERYGVPMTKEQYETLRDEAGEYLRPKVEQLEG